MYVFTVGPPGHVTIAWAPAKVIMSAMPTLRFLARDWSFEEMSWRPLFSGRLYSWARIREPSQPPVLPWALLHVPQTQAFQRRL